MEAEEGRDAQEEILRAISALRLAQEILSRLVVTGSDSMGALLQARAEALGNRLTRSELAVITEYVEGNSPEAIAEDRGLSSRTISNQIRSGCHKLGFSDRRELRGWSVAVRWSMVKRGLEDWTTM